MMKSKSRCPDATALRPNKQLTTLIQMQDNKELYDSQIRLVLKRLSPVLKKHAEILAFYEAKNLKKKTHDVSHIVGRNGKICTIYKIQNKNNEQKGHDKNTKLS
jgi:hypothetical protein